MPRVLSSILEKVQLALLLRADDHQKHQLCTSPACLRRDREVGT